MDLAGVYIDCMSIPRYLSIVRFDFDGFPKDFDTSVYPFDKDERFIFLGEIPNMPGHCVVLRMVTGPGLVKPDAVFGYHTENFVELPTEEI